MRRAISLLCVLVALSMLIIACAGPTAPAPTAAPAPKPTSTPAATATPTAKPTATPTPTATTAAKPIKLVFATHATLAYPISKGTQEWMDAVEKATNGQVKFEGRYWSEALFKAGEILDALSTNSIDVTLGGLSNFTETVPMADAALMPFAHRDHKSSTEAFRGELGTIVNKEMAKRNTIVTAWPSWGFSQVFTNKRLAKMPADLVGLKVRSNSSSQGQLIQAAGGAAVFMASGEMYMAMQRGTIDGFLTNLDSATGRKMEEITKYVAINNCAQNIGGIVFSLSKWNSLPKNLQDIIMKECVVMEDKIIAAITNDEQKSIDVMKKAGMQVYYSTPEELAAWRKLAEPLWAEWTAKTGDPGKRALELMLKYATQ